MNHGLQTEFVTFTYMLIDASYDQTVVVRLHFICHECGHKVDCGLHALVLNLLVFVNEVTRGVDRSRDTRVGRGPTICQLYASVHGMMTRYPKEVRDPAKLPQTRELPCAFC